MKRAFFTAAIAASLLTSCNQPSSKHSSTASSEDIKTEVTEASASTSGELAYINVDLVLSQSELFNKEGVALQTKTQKAQESWARREQGFQQEAATLQDKYQKGLITTLNAQKEQASLEQKMRSYQESASTEAKQLDEENVVFTNRAQDLIRRSVKSINAEGKYKMIINASSLIDADSTLDISAQVLEVMNNLYAAEK